MRKFWNKFVDLFTGTLFMTLVFFGLLYVAEFLIDLVIWL